MPIQWQKANHKSLGYKSLNRWDTSNIIHVGYAESRVESESAIRVFVAHIVIEKYQRTGVMETLICKSTRTH